MLLRQLEGPGATLTSGRSKPLGRIVSTSAVLGPAGWKRRSKRDKTGRGWARPGQPGSLSDSLQEKDRPAIFAPGYGRSRPHRLEPIHSVKSLDGKREGSELQGVHGSFGLFLPEHMEFLAQYQAYTNTRKLLENQGFFDTGLDHKKLAGEHFGFNQQEQLLSPPETREKNSDQHEVDFSSEVAEAGQKVRLCDKRTNRVS
ncbi:hypothetical protein ElyMa_004119200 [Elysia marginata]|uniref:Uncharacterized protein n=1 Tax=Elysia marginata TaxID=1093978 RepID=A0AAV4GF41_9GAST|nr:hypothetical protein ElyMa_004119200 [Elysia marginata]